MGGGRQADRQTRPRATSALLVRARAVTLELSEGFQSARVLLTVRQTRGRARDSGPGAIFLRQVPLKNDNRLTYTLC